MSSNMPSPEVIEKLKSAPGHNEYILPLTILRPIRGG